MGASAPDIVAFRPPQNPPAIFPPVQEGGCRADGRIGPLHLFSVDPTGKPCYLPTPMEGGPGAVAVALASQPTRITQRGFSVLLSPREWTLLRPSYPVTMEGAAVVQVAVLPAWEFSEGNIFLPRLMLRQFSHESSINRVTFSLMRAIFDEAGKVSPGCAEELARAAIHVMKRALIEIAGGLAPKEILAVRIREFVGWHIRDPDLSPEKIARALNCSPRNIHRAFSGGAETLSQYVLRLRLERCLADLMAGAKTRSVTEIAFSWGFNNGAHFSRVFKKQFGRSPRACRSLQPGLCA